MPVPSRDGRAAAAADYAAGDDPERPVRQPPLRLEGLVERRRHPSLDFFRRRQDHRHHLGIDGVDLGVRLPCQERVCRSWSCIHLPDRSPIRPEAGKAGKGAGLVDREPDVAAFGFVKLAERVERHQAPVFYAEPPRPVFFTLRMFVVPPSGSIFRSRLKSIVCPLASSFCARFFRFHERVLRRRHAPSRGGQLVAVYSTPDNRRLVVRKGAR